MKRVMHTLILMSVSCTFATDKPANVPEKAKPAYNYAKAVLTDDLEGFKGCHTKRALEAYKSSGGVDKIFEKVKSLFKEKYKGATLADFTFTVSEKPYEVPGGQLKLDGEYYMVGTHVEKAGGDGMIVEKEGGSWKITVPRYKNLEEVLKKFQEKKKEASNK